MNPYANSASIPVTQLPTSTYIPVNQLIHKGILEIIISEDPSFLAQAAQTAIAHYLPLAPQINKFRVSWHFSGPSYLNDGSALYDRKLGTLHFYHYRGFSDTKFPKQHLLFHGVTDEILIKMAQKDAQTENGAGDGFIHLQNYGCKVTKLK